MCCDDHHSLRSPHLRPPPRRKLLAAAQGFTPENPKQDAILYIESYFPHAKVVHHIPDHHPWFVCLLRHFYASPCSILSERFIRSRHAFSLRSSAFRNLNFLLTSRHFTHPRFSIYLHSTLQSLVYNSESLVFLTLQFLHSFAHFITPPSRSRSLYLISMLIPFEIYFFDLTVSQQSI